MRYNSFLHIFPEQCAKYLHDKFKMHSELTVRELMVILKRIGIKTIKIHNNGKIYDVFYKREIDGIQDFEFLNNLHEYRRAKQIRDEWSKEPLIDYTPELSNMQNASDELLRQDEVYYTNESQKIIKYNMERDNKKALYESIMTSVAKEVKKVLNEGEIHEPKTIKDIIADLIRKYDKKEVSAENVIEAIRKGVLYDIIDIQQNDNPTLYAGQLLNGVLNYKDKKIKISKLDTKVGNIFFSYYIKGQGIQHGFLLNDEQSKVVPYYWVDKDGIEHNTKDEWVKNATYIIDDYGNKVIGIEWKKLNTKDTIIGYIKKWYELTYKI